MMHIIDMTNHLPEAGSKTPIEKPKGSALNIDDMVEAFGAEVWYYDAPPRRVSTATTLDTPGRRGILYTCPKTTRAQNLPLLNLKLGA